MPLYLNPAVEGVSDPDEPAEREADAIAEHVMTAHSGEPPNDVVANSLGQSLDEVRIHTTQAAANAATSTSARTSISRRPDPSSACWRTSSPM
jgi:hypothetical protein